MDDKTGKMTVVGVVDVPIIVKRLRKICNAELVTVEVVKPPEKKPEPEKPTPAKPAEIVAFPVTQFNYPYQYHYSSANSYYQPCENYRVAAEEPNTCAMM
ncbi:Heavy metal-associated isoprenylated plant protein 13 [Hirschfeldia incana]|nr:Heavy metal-associated isoprenylated plant protein 13 [Hirschfeldia incana]